MATIQTSFVAIDRLTQPMRSMYSAVSTLVSGMEQAQNTFDTTFDTTVLQDVRADLAEAATGWNEVEQEIRQADQAQRQFKQDVDQTTNSADALGGKLKTILATVGSIATLKMGLNWVQENMDLADTQRNAENQLAAVLANMGVQDVTLPVAVKYGIEVPATDPTAQLTGMGGTAIETTLTMDTTPAVSAYNKVTKNFSKGQSEMTLTLDAGDAVSTIADITATAEGAAVAVNGVSDTLNQLDGTMVQEVVDLDAGAIPGYVDTLNQLDGARVETVAVVTADTTQAMSAYDAIVAKAAEIQSRGIYGDEAMIAGAAELSTYFTDAEAIISMMDTLSNYAMGMSGGAELDTTAMVNYATGIGKIMSGAYDAMTEKGFKFTDAQKAVIEGTATQAQYIEALGADYASMSEDMRAATVINDIISESWNGLYETMSNTPQGQIIQFNNRLGDLRETLGNRIYPAVLKFYSAFSDNFPQIQQILTAFSDFLGSIIVILGWLAEGAIEVATVIVDNWEWIGPIIYGVAGALMVYHGAQLAAKAAALVSTGVHVALAGAQMIQLAATGSLTAATAAETAAQYGLNAALYACPLVWIIILIIAIIALFYAVIGAINQFAGTSISATGAIMRAFAALVAFLWNLILGALELVMGVLEYLVNPFIQLANFIGNVFTNPVSSIIYLFQGMADTVLGILQKIASALDFVFGSNMADTVQSWRDGLKAAADDMVAEYAPNENYQEIMNNLDFSVDDLGLDRIAYGDAWDAGYDFGQGIEDTIGGAFDFDSMMGDMDAFNIGNTLDGIYNNTADTATNTAAGADTLEIAEEDLKYLRDIAEREAINRFVTAEITVEQHNENHIEKDADVDGIMDAWAADFAEKLDISGEGVHE